MKSLFLSIISESASRCFWLKLIKTQFTFLACLQNLLMTGCKPNKNHGSESRQTYSLSTSSPCGLKWPQGRVSDQSGRILAWSLLPVSDALTEPPSLLFCLTNKVDNTILFKRGQKGLRSKPGLWLLFSCLTLQSQGIHMSLSLTEQTKDRFINFYEKVTLCDLGA